MNTKILVLTLTLIIASSLTATVQGQNPLLVNIMQEHFNRSATDLDLIEARDARGYTILHVLFEKIALTRNTSELMPLFFATHSINKTVKEQLNQALAKEGKTFEKDAELLVEQIMSNTSQEMAANINANFTLLYLYQQHIRCKRENIRLKNDNHLLEIKTDLTLPWLIGLCGGLVIGITVGQFIEFSPYFN